MAAMLDLLTSDKAIAFGSRTTGLVPSEIDAVVTNKQKADELSAYAESRMREYLDAGQKLAKRHGSGDVSIYSLDFKNLRTDDSDVRYPLPGRYSSHLLNRLAGGDSEAVLLLYFGRYISIRITPSVSNEINLRGIIREIIDSTDYAESGGGHNNAASIKLKDELFRKEVIAMIIGGVTAALAQ
jgi:RecJ-like exonuclease